MSNVLEAGPRWSAEFESGNGSEKEGKQESRAHYVNEFSSEDEDSRKHRSTPRDELFGESGLALDLRIAENAKGSPLSRAEEDEIYQNSMDMPKKMLVHRIEMAERRKFDDDAGKPAEDFILEACEVPYLREALTTAFGKDPREGVTMAEVKAIIEDGGIDDRTFAGMIARHHEAVGEKMAASRVEVEKLQAELLGDIERLRAAGVITTPSEVIAKRLERTHVVFIDPLEASPNRRGSHDSTGKLVMRIDEDSRGQKHVYYHEMVHALLQGVTLRTWNEGPFTSIQEVKSGLRFEKPVAVEPGQRDRSPRERTYIALNEAITEELALVLLGDREKYEDSSYGVDRLRLEKVIEAGVPLQAFFDAYQESGDAAAPDDLPAWERLQQLAAASTGDGPGYFMGLAGDPDLA